jgi:hypothetical protein
MCLAQQREPAKGPTRHVSVLLMSDPLALFSVMFSWLVAMGALFMSYRSGSEQRRHEERLARQQRGWDKMLEGLFDVISSCRFLADAIDRRGSMEVIEELDAERGAFQSAVKEHLGVSEIGVRVADVVDRLNHLVPIVEVYASTECRDAFHDLRRMLRDSGYDPRAADRLDAVRRSKSAAIDAKDYQGAATARRLERAVLEDARSRLTIDLGETRARAERLIDAARNDLDW